MGNRVLPETSTEHGQFHQIGCGHRFERMPGFAPGAKAPRDDEGAKSLLSQQQRHPGAGRFPRSSTVDEDIFLTRQSFQLLGETVGLEPD